ncbi:MAG: bifunctional alpha/beta hydrolase/class I SAM-dependent methyltransferase [Bryobacteraceae bacterium]
MNTRIPEEHFFAAGDGARLFYRAWQPANGSAQNPRAIVLLHRGHEHSGRLQHVVDELNLPDFAMFAWDARGHGHSRDSLGSDTSLATFVRDLDAFVSHVCREHGVRIEDVAIVAQSVGSVLAATWVHDYAPRIRCMVLASPAFKVKLYVPFARAGLNLLHHVIGDFNVNSYVKARALTHDPERIRSFESDPLIQRPISARVLLGLYSTSGRVVTDARGIRTPVQLLISGSDWVVHHGPQHEFFERLGSTIKEKHVFEGFYHDTLGEKDRGPVIDKVRRFLLARFAESPRHESLLHADRNGHTKEEYDQLCRPLPALSPRRVVFATTRFGLKTGGRLSDGIRLGLKTGFDSGSTLDYVYRCNASGLTPAGTLIDWLYLHSIGWRGIRVRRENLRELIVRSALQLQSEGKPVRILDIAAGHGRYVLETAAQLQPRPERVTLRDYSDINVQEGRALIRQNGLDELAAFGKGDAFDRAQLAAIRPRPTLGIVSGLYELFPDNDTVGASLAGLADAIEPGGYLIYTGQPWHPQLEFIARVLPSHRDHKPWIMRRRTQAELDELVEHAGFTKTSQLIDDWGIFTVSVAQRRAA